MLNADTSTKGSEALATSPQQLVPQSRPMIAPLCQGTLWDVLGLMQAYAQAFKEDQRDPLHFVSSDPFASSQA